MSINHTQNIIEINHISYAYTRQLILQDVTFNIHRGDYIGIIGPNGGGKTTLLKIILGLLRPTSGNIRLFGIPVSQFTNWPKIGYIPQKIVNLENRFPATVADIVGMGLYAKRGLLHRLTTADHKLITQTLAQVEMEQLRDELIGNLSGGQQQRVFVARELVAQPEVMILDEPTVGVDIKAQTQFYALLRQLNRQHAITMVIVSHDIDVIAAEATEIACINQTLVYHATPEEFIKGNLLQKLYSKNLVYLGHQH